MRVVSSSRRALALVGLLCIIGSCTVLWGWTRLSRQIWRVINVPAELEDQKLELTLENHPTEWLIDTRHRVLFCAIYKNSMSQWMKLLLESTGRLKREDIARPYPAFDPAGSQQAACDEEQDPSSCAVPEGSLAAMSVDPTWRKIVVLRDPFERVLSAWLDKCAHANQVQARLRNRVPRWCRAGGRTPKPTPEDFRLWLKLLYDALKALSRGSDTWTQKASKLLADPHLRPQHMACGLGKKGRGGWRRYVTRALYMSSPRYALEAAEVLAPAGFDREVVAHYLPSRAEKASTNKEHATSAASKAAAFSSPEVAHMVRWIYAGDYALLRFFGYGE